MIEDKIIARITEIRDECQKRVAEAKAAIESGDNNALWFDKFRHYNAQQAACAQILLAIETIIQEETAAPCS